MTEEKKVIIFSIDDITEQTMDIIANGLADLLGRKYHVVIINEKITPINKEEFIKIVEGMRS